MQLIGDGALGRTAPAKEGLCTLCTVTVFPHGLSQTHEQSHSHLCLCSRITPALSSLVCRPKTKRLANPETVKKKNFFFLNKWTIMVLRTEHRAKSKKEKNEDSCNWTTINFLKKFWFLYFWIVELKAIYLMFLKFSLCLYKIGVLITSQVCREEWTV